MVMVMVVMTVMVVMMAVFFVILIYDLGVFGLAISLLGVTLLRISVHSVCHMPLCPPGRPGLIIIVVCGATLRHCVLPTSPATVSLLGKIVRLLLSLFVGLMPVNPVHAFRLDKFVDFSCSNACEDFLCIVEGMNIMF